MFLMTNQLTMAPLYCQISPCNGKIKFYLSYVTFIINYSLRCSYS